MGAIEEPQEPQEPQYFWHRGWKALRGWPLWVRRSAALVSGLITGPLSVQGLYRAIYMTVGFAWDSWATVGPALVVLAGAALLWFRGHRWFAGGLVAGTIAWNAFLFWLITYGWSGSENFD